MSLSRRRVYDVSVSASRLLSHFHLFYSFIHRGHGLGWRIRENVLGSLEIDVRVPAGVEEQMLVVGGLLEDVGAQRVAGLPVVEVIELRHPLAQPGGLAVGAGARDLVADDGGRQGGGEDVEGGLSVSASPVSAPVPISVSPSTPPLEGYWAC